MLDWLCVKYNRKYLSLISELVLTRIILYPLCIYYILLGKCLDVELQGLRNVSTVGVVGTTLHIRNLRQMIVA